MTSSKSNRSEIAERGLAPFGALAGVEWEVRAGVRVKAGVLSWPMNGRVLRRHHDPKGDYWLSFLALGDLEGPALDRAVRTYAARWGPLHLCEAHGLPVTHPPTITPGHLHAVNQQGQCPARSANGRFEEPVERWRELARQAGVVLLARADLEEGDTVPKHRFEAMTGALPLGYSAPGTNPLPIPSGRKAQAPAGQMMIGPIVVRLRLSAAQAVGIAAQQWFQMSDVAPRFRWEGGDFALSFQSHTLFGALALRLASSLTDARPLVKCDYGNHWYTQTRRNTYFCGVREECKRERLNANARRRRAGKARKYAPRTGGADSKGA